MEYVCSICQSMAETHDCLEILNREWLNLSPEKFLKEFHTEEELFGMRSRVKDLEKKFWDVYQARKDALRKADSFMEAASRVHSNAEKYSKLVASALIEKLND